MFLKNIFFLLPLLSQIITCFSLQSFLDTRQSTSITHYTLFSSQSDDLRFCHRLRKVLWRIPFLKRKKKKLSSVQELSSSQLGFIRDHGYTFKLTLPEAWNCEYNHIFKELRFVYFQRYYYSANFAYFYVMNLICTLLNI